MHELHHPLACLAHLGLAVNFAFAFNPSSPPAHCSLGGPACKRLQSVGLGLQAILEKPDTLTSPRPFDTVFALPVMDGLFLAANLPVDESSAAELPFDELHPREREVLTGMKPHRQTSFAGGRIALRRALEAAGESALAEKPVLSSKSGAPAIPPGIVGSISHTHGAAAAFICPLRVLGEECIAHNAISKFSLGSNNKRCAVGVDIEPVDRKVPLKLATKVLAEEERQTLGLSGLSAESDLLLRVSIKESLYKAMHPLVRRSIRWHSVKIQPGRDGSCTVDSTELEQEVGKTLVTKVRWGSHEGYFWSTATCVAHP
mmetsp:Transcript_105613/g.192117  ORF Transcript_105613/g.192117 Transcript_105613/m.192117 type:complete len:316 (+) Transcript_105613:63-1010(+)